MTAAQFEHLKTFNHEAYRAMKKFLDAVPAEDVSPAVRAAVASYAAWGEKMNVIIGRGGK